MLVEQINKELIVNLTFKKLFVGEYLLSFSSRCENESTGGRKSEAFTCWYLVYC